MKISYSWLKDYLQTDLASENISEILTDIGLEVEGIEKFESIKGNLKGIVVGKVLTCEKHPNADKLNLTTVDVGAGSVLNIVCGAPNVAAGQTVPVATVGTKIYTKDGGSVEIKEAKIRGEKSQGMICSAAELGLNDDHSGIMVLDETNYKVGQSFASYFNLSDDEVFEIGLTPNRTDSMSHYGVARDLKAFFEADGQDVKFNFAEDFSIESTGTHDFKLNVEDAALVPRYMGAVMKDVTVMESPEWLKNRLKAIGLSPINNIVDATNYILHGLGQPLHAFDAEKIKGNTIRVGKNQKGTKFTTLDGVERTLDGTEIMIKDADDSPLCIAGVFGGSNSGVSPSTTSIILESAYFNPVAIRKGAKFHGLNTDASFRFERGVDPEMTAIALKHAVKLIIELSGGHLAGDILEFYPEKFEPHHIELRQSKIPQILGTEIEKTHVEKILKSLEIGIINEENGNWQLQVPRYRADVTREIDVIEEILRIYGYNKVEAPAKFSFTPAKVDHKDQDALENFWAAQLQANGYNEVMNNSLTNVKDEKNAVKLLNPLSSDLAFMRKSLLEGMLQNASYNINRKSADLKFFEIGKIYHKFEQYTERKQIAVLATGRNQAENWLVQKSASSFNDLKGIVTAMLDKLALTTTERLIEDERFSSGVEIIADGGVLARIGSVSDSLLKDFDINQPVFYAEIELELAQALRSGRKIAFKDVPRFNRNRRDLALLVDRNVLYSEMLAAINEDASPYLKNVNLFDVYEGEKLPGDKKSYALSFEILNEEKTMEEKEIAEIMQKIINKMTSKFKAELR